MNTKKTLIWIGIILGLISPFIIDRYVKELTDIQKYTTSVIFILISFYFGWAKIKELLKKKDVKPQKEITMEQAIKIFQGMKRGDPDYVSAYLDDDIDEMVTELDARPLSVGQPGAETIIYGIQARGYHHYLYSYFLINPYDKKEFRISAFSIEPTKWDIIEREAQMMAEKRERIPERETLRIFDPTTQEVQTHIKEKGLPDLPEKKQETGVSFE